MRCWCWLLLLVLGCDGDGLRAPLSTPSSRHDGQVKYKKKTKCPSVILCSTIQGLALSLGCHMHREKERKRGTELQKGEKERKKSSSNYRSTIILQLGILGCWDPCECHLSPLVFPSSSLLPPRTSHSSFSSPPCILSRR